VLDTEVIEPSGCRHRWSVTISVADSLGCGTLGRTEDAEVCNEE
jgi:hypothetical protein